MRSFHNHYWLKDISDAPGSENELIAAAIYDDLPLAIWAVGCFIGEATKGPDGRRLPYKDSEMEPWLSDGEWLYLDPPYIPLFLTQDKVEMGFYLSSPESSVVDRWAQRRDSKIFVSMDMLYVPEGSIEDHAELEALLRPPTPDGVPMIGAKDLTSRRIEEGKRAAMAILKRLNDDGNLPERKKLMTDLEKANIAEEILSNPVMYPVCSEYMDTCSHRSNYGDFARRYPILGKKWPAFATQEDVLAVFKKFELNQ